MSSIKLNVGGTLFESSISTLEHSLYFKNMFEMFGDNIPDIIFVDRDPENFKYVLKFLRDENYKVPCEVESELKFFLINYNDENILDKQLIKINVGGTIFETNKSTVRRSGFLRELINENKNETCIFVDRDPDNFKHILNFIRDDNYKVPHILRYELKFYEIRHSIINLEYTFPKNFISLLDCISDFCEICNHELSSSELKFSKKIHIYLSRVFKHNIDYVGHYCKNCVCNIINLYDVDRIKCSRHSYISNMDELFVLHKCVCIRHISNW